jgi:hypothetical protein
MGSPSIQIGILWLLWAQQKKHTTGSSHVHSPRKSVVHKTRMDFLASEAFLYAYGIHKSFSVSDFVLIRVHIGSLLA